MALPRDCLYGVPGPLHVTAVPSPIAHRTLVTLAVAVTVTPPAVAEAVAGPNVDGDGVAHIHVGIPTTYVPAARGLATFGGSRRIDAAARRATSSGSIVGAAGASWPFGRNTTPPRSLSHTTL
ncbi:hypothetical protein OOK43_31695 [[Kitasatospora] papulosa]|uniref:hypothetical protein n=1 Tax=Streptomyces TaxID=1883 RepID=UPI002251F043|nr:hypothetical protein [[Kitasatospora] papulosa]MCX4417803.1 hypothetical protein [[Kitasatospora] papulosa]